MGAKLSGPTPDIRHPRARRCRFCRFCRTVPLCLQRSDHRLPYLRYKIVPGTHSISISTVALSRCQWIDRPKATLTR